VALPPRAGFFAISSDILTTSRINHTDINRVAIARIDHLGNVRVVLPTMRRIDVLTTAGTRDEERGQREQNEEAKRVFDFDTNPKGGS
jgi:hypothetical protein